MDRAGEHRARSLSEKGLQIFAVVGAPVAWATEFVISYAITQHTCSTGRVWQLHLLTLLALAMALAAVTASYRTWQAAPKITPQDAGTAMGRSLFLGVLGLMTSAFFTLAIVAEAVPRWMMSPCD